MTCKNELSKKKENVLYGEEERVHNINIGNMILSALKSKPDFIGQIAAETDEQITYQQMLENSVKCALWLKDEEYCKDVKIAICTSHPMLSYIPFLAGLYFGAVINPWEREYFEDEMRVMYFLVEYKPNIFFVDENDYQTLIRSIQRLNSNSEVIKPPRIITFGKVAGIEDISLESILKHNFDKNRINNYCCKDTNPMDIMATLFSTDATTFRTKANVRYFALTYPSNQEIPTMSPGDVGLWYGSLNWTYGLILTVRSIVSYVTVIKCSRFYDENMYRAIEKYKVKWMFLQSEMCNQLFQTDIRMYNVSSLKQLIFGNSVINCSIYKKLVEHFTNASIVRVYYISDAGIIVSYQRNSNQIGSNGHLAKNINLKIVQEKTSELMGPNALGEIQYKFMCKWCSTTCTLPHCNKDMQKKQNVRQTSAAITCMWHSTGDYGFYDKDGEICFVDKIKNLIKYKSFCLSPIRIENILRSHPIVSEVVVKSLPDSENGQVPVAYITRKSGAEFLRDEDLLIQLMKLMKHKLPDIFKLRGGLYIKAEMPHLPNGKIDRELVKRY